jgi:hypothetical protein
MAGPPASPASFSMANSESRLPNGAPREPQVPHECPQNSLELASWAIDRRNMAVQLSGAAKRKTPRPGSRYIRYNGAHTAQIYVKFREHNLY